MICALVLLVLVTIGAFVGTNAMIRILPQDGGSIAEKALLVLFGVLFALDLGRLLDP